MPNNLTIWKAIQIGGPVMYVLILCSIVSITIILERLYYFYKRSRISRISFLQSIREEMKKSDIKKVIKRCHDTLTPFASVAGVGFNSFDLDEKEIAESMERQIVIEINELEMRTAIVGTIASTSVYIGLLGTVWGIIKTFQDIYHAGSGGINVVINGVSEALICTAAGLFVAIPAVAAYNYFVKRVKGFVMDMELCASEITSLIKLKKSQTK